MSSSWMQFQEKDPAPQLAWHRRLEAWLKEWQDTPYMHNLQVRGTGVDCIRFGAAVEDYLHGFEPAEDMPNLPPDTSMHRVDLSMAVVRWFSRRYPNDIVFRKNDDPLKFELMPSDIVVTVNKGSVPCHIMIAGPRKNTLWHSINDHARDGAGGVDYTGLGWAINQGIYRIWRMKGSSTWT